VNDPTLRRTVCQIAEYWLARPQACDTRTGVRAWWLREPFHVLQVQQALDALVEAGIARAWAAPASQDHGGSYGLAVTPEELHRWLAAYRDGAPLEPWPTR
jgi:hypothetical protein